MNAPVDEYSRGRGEGKGGEVETSGVGEEEEDDTCGLGISIGMPVQRKIRLLSFNCNILPTGATFFATGQGTSGAERMELILQRIESGVVEGNGYDVLALQEVFATPFLWGLGLDRQTLFLRRLYEMGYQYSSTCAWPTPLKLLRECKWTDGGLLIVSRIPIIASDRYVFESATKRSLDAGTVTFKTQIFYLD
jgi:hypothetical protein